MELSLEDEMNKQFYNNVAIPKQQLTEWSACSV